MGWTHCIQQRDIAQEAIERNLTLISWESMHQWSDNGEKGMHIFHKNNEIAGYAAVLHTLQLLGIDGYYGPRRTVAVLGYGSVSRGAIYALQGRGFNNIRVYTRRPTYLIACQNPDVYYFNYSADESGSLTVKFADGSTTPLINELSKADIICNGILQDVDRPVLFVNQADIEHLQNPTIIIDISCDRGMGFSFARPTSFSEPIIKIADRIHYYSVDHTASYIWNAASREISRSLIPFIGNISEGPDSWEQNSIIRNAIDIKDGKVRNKKILSFQKRI